MNRILARAHEAVHRAPRAIFVVAAIAHAGLITFLSHVPGDRMPSAGYLASIFFNLAHAPFFGWLAFLTALSLAGREPTHRYRLGSRGAILAAALSFGFGVFDEWHQSFVSGRSSDPTDLVTDLAGIGFGVIAARVVLEGEAPDRTQLCAAAACVLAAVAAAVVAS